jgi:hypothetical protein
LRDTRNAPTLRERIKRKYNRLRADRESQLLFPSPRGGYFDLHNFRNRYWKPAQIAAGIVPLRRVYDLRHTFATFALRAGISTFDLSCYMGASLTISTATTATSHATDESTQSGSWTATRTSKPTTSKPWTSNGRRSCPSSPATTTERPLEQEETESPLTDSNRRPPPYHAIVAATGRNRRQRFSLDSAVFGRGPFASGLPPVATTGLHKGSILCCLYWLRQRDRRTELHALVGVSVHAGGASASS